MLDYQQLKEILPHAYPFLLIDRVEEYKEGERLVAVKNITGNEWTSGGGETPVFPEVLLIEAAAQAALVLYHVSKIKSGPKPRYVLGRAKAEFHDFLLVGDNLRILAFADKMLDTGGYSTINLSKGSRIIGKITIIYSVLRQSSPRV